MARKVGKPMLDANVKLFIATELLEAKDGTGDGSNLAVVTRNYVA